MKKTVEFDSSRLIKPQNNPQGKYDEECINALISLAEASLGAVECTFEKEKPLKMSPLVHLNKLSVISAPAAALLLCRQNPLICCAGVFVAAAVPLLISTLASRKTVPTEAREPELIINYDKIHKGLNDSFLTLLNLLERASLSNKTAEESSELCNNKEFARWIQTFALKVIKSDNEDSYQLLYSLQYQLERLGIYLYYKLDIRPDGSVRLPEENYFIDDRDGEEWTRVALPVVYTKDRLLALGRIV